MTSTFNWSKCIDERSQPANAGFVTENGSAGKLRYGRCDFDQSYTFRNTAIWKAPALNNGDAVVRTIAGSWTASGLLVFDAGQPFGVTDTNDYSYTDLGLDLADRVPGVSLHKNGHLNWDAFTNNASGTYGDSGRNSFRSPNYVDLDLALLKLFKLTERVSTTFRAEAFNLFNHPNFLPPNISGTPPPTILPQAKGPSAIRLPHAISESSSFRSRSPFDAITLNYGLPGICYAS